MAGKGVSLVVSIVGDTEGLSKTLGAAGADVSAFGGTAAKTAAKLVPMAGAAVAAGAAIFDMTKAAEADRTEQKKLEQAISAAGAATAESTAQVEAAIKAGQDKAFSDSETRDAMQSLVTATGDVTAATDLLTTAQDIARFAGVDLATAADAVAKAAAGQDKALKTLIPGLEIGATATDTLANASAAAAGQADIYAESAEGMAAKGKDAFGELAETIGSVFLPILDAILPAIIPIIEAFGTLVEALLPFLIPLIDALAAALKIVSDVLVKVAGGLEKVLNWVQKLLEPLNNLIGKLQSLNPFKDMKLPSFGGHAAGVSGLQAATTAGATGGSGGVVINIYGDPAVIEAKVTKALRDYTRRNGVGSVFTPGRS